MKELGSTDKTTLQGQRKRRPECSYRMCSQPQTTAADNSSKYLDTSRFDVIECDASELRKCSGKLDKTSATSDMIYLMKLSRACNTMTTGGLLVWPEPATGWTCCPGQHGQRGLIDQVLT